MKRYPQITHVAIKFLGEVYSLPRPNRHHDVIRKIVFDDKVAESVDGDEQGFLDEDGRFLTRHRALRLAQVNGQYDGEGRLGMLFSEDIW
jgi:hypothetical protein